MIRRSAGKFQADGVASLRGSGKMAESTNILPIEKDSLYLYLSKDELELIEYDRENQNDTSVCSMIYKDYGELYKTKNFSLRILFRNACNNGPRDYVFFLRSYSPEYRLIDSYELAVWKEEEHTYCFGSIDKKLQIAKQCDHSKTTIFRVVVT
jgi:hypothetical protein